VATNVRLSGAQSTPREESDLRVNYTNLQQIVAASTQLGGTQPMHYSGDGGATWDQSSLPAFGAPDVRQGDPAIDWTSDGTAWSLTIGISAALELVLRCFKSIDAGATWTFESTLPGGQKAMDREALWIDHHPNSPHRDNMYAYWHNGNPGFVAVRAGPAGTWSSPLQVSGAETTGTASAGDIKTNAYGDVFAFWPDTGSRKLFVVKSTNGGTSFGTPVQAATTVGAGFLQLPAQDTRDVLISVSGGAYRTATKDMVYVCWTDLAGGAGCSSTSDQPGSDVTSACKSRIWFVRSLDGGTTWETPTKINDQVSKNDQFFARMALDETSGDLMVVYYDTVSDPGRLKADIWMQSSSDDGVTWSAPVKVTTSATDETASTAQSNFQYGDYIGLTGYAGQFFACWTDRRSGGVEEIWGAPLPLVQRAVTFEIDRDHFGQDEVDAARTQPGGAVFQTAFRIAVDGFTARELGVTGASSTGLAPAVTFSPSSGIKATCSKLDSTDPSFSPDVLQRIRFVYDVDFGSDDSAFMFGGDSEPVTLTATFQGMPAAGQITLIKQPNPYILQGQETWWLSSDVRVLQIVEGEKRFGVTMNNDPQAFLADLTAALETGQGTAGSESFDANTSEQNEILTVAPFALRGFPPVPRNVYNFALARVHYRGLNPADHVRVFFRLFAANSTATDFHEDTTYSRDPSVYPVPPAQWGEHTIPTPGVLGGEYVTIPCFAAPRQAADQAGAPNSLPSLQQDTANDKPLAATGGPVHDVFYGALLDINQSAAVYPSGGTVPAGNADGPWPPSTGVALEPVSAAFIRGEHQCLMAEIAFDPVPITAGTQPWNSDKLAQRNLSWSTVANPGLNLSRTALETFEVRPTPVSRLDVPPDEIVIEWNDVPAGEQAQLYLPAVDADAVLATASRLYPTHRLTRVDANTIGCETGGVTYIPLAPGTGDGTNFAGLMSIGLPAGIRRGQLYHVVVRQLTNAFGAVEPPPPEITGKAGPERFVGLEGGEEAIRWRRVLGTFQINIPVSTKELMLETEELRYSIFQWIAATIPVSSRWYKVFQRYIALLGTRVGELGGDPAQIKPSQNGYDGLPGARHRHDGRHHRPHRYHGFTGKVEGVVYDHFGDFSGFILELMDGDERHFESREREIEELVREAWAERILITVVPEPEDDDRVRNVILRR
jgi:hypothetical protein